MPSTMNRIEKLEKFVKLNEYDPFKYYGVHLVYTELSIHTIYIPAVESAVGSGETFSEAMAEVRKSLAQELANMKTPPEDESLDKVYAFGAMVASHCDKPILWDVVIVDSDNFIAISKSNTLPYEAWVQR
jgi:hypothetical protein